MTEPASEAPAPLFASRAAIARRGLMFVISSPSGAGKTTLSKRLLAADPLLTLSISATTRPKRDQERDGVDYHFMSAEAFSAMREDGGFLEHAEVFGNRYGTPRAPVEAWLAEGQDVLFDVDWQGARQLREAAPQDVATVFILPPSIEALEHRLRRRAQDAEEVVRSRMRKAHAEISHWNEYDYVIVNDALDAAEATLKGVLAAERARRVRQTGLEDFVAGFGPAP